jgi:single-stranded DNA-binding protein
MSYINDVRLVGEVVVPPEKKTSQKGTAYLVLDMRTARFQEAAAGKKVWVFQTHRVVIFNKESIAACEGLQIGNWITVMGELTYFQGGRSGQITVSDRLGDARPMFADYWAPTPDVTDEEIALIAAAEGAPADAKAKAKDDKPAAKDAKASKTADKTERDIDDEIPF